MAKASGVVETPATRARAPGIVLVTTISPFTLDRAIALIKQGNAMQAIDELNGEAVPLDAHELAAVGCALVNDKSFGLAIDMLRRAKALDKTLVDMREALARALMAEGEKGLAKEEASEVAALLTGSRADLERLRNLYADLHAWEPALATTNRILALDPRNLPLIKFQIDMCFRAKKPDEARRILDRLTAADNVSAGELMFAAETHIRFQTRSGAEASYDLAIRAAKAGFVPVSATKITLIDALFQLGRPSKAKHEVAALTEMASTALELTQAAEFQMKLGDCTSAVRAVHHAIRICKGELEALRLYWRLAILLCKCGCRVEAQALLQQVVVDTLKGERALRDYHEAFFEASLDAPALQAAERVLELKPYDSLMMQRVAIIRLTARARAVEAKSAIGSPAAKGLLGRLLGR